jgi:hypothetical protein
MNASLLLSKSEFYGSGDYAKSLRAAYNNNYYAYYSKNAPLLFENPLKKTHEKYLKAKKAQYMEALANKNRAENLWNQYKLSYEQNLASMRIQNNGTSLSSSQRKAALNGAGRGAGDALLKYNNAKSEEEYAFSLLRDATSSSISLLS